MNSIFGKRKVDHNDFTDGIICQVILMTDNQEITMKSCKLISTLSYKLCVAILLQKTSMQSLIYYDCNFTNKHKFFIHCHLTALLNWGYEII